MGRFSGLLLAVLILASAGAAKAEDTAAVMDRFYDGLADVIEKNMGDPDECAGAVDDYYVSHSADVEAIRNATAKGIEKAADLMEKEMEKYENMTEEELAALEEKAGGYSVSKTMSPGMARYAAAMERFTQKYPSQGAMISMKAMQFLPGNTLQQAEE